MGGIGPERGETNGKLTLKSNTEPLSAKQEGKRFNFDIFFERPLRALNTISDSQEGHSTTWSLDLYRLFLVLGCWIFISAHFSDERGSEHWGEHLLSQDNIWNFLKRGLFGEPPWENPPVGTSVTHLWTTSPTNHMFRPPRSEKITGNAKTLQRHLKMTYLQFLIQNKALIHFESHV